MFPSQALRVHVHEFAANLPILHSQPSDAHRKLEPSRSRAAGIEVKDSVARLLLRNVTVAADHDPESSSFWFEIQLRQIVKHINGYAAHFENVRLWKRQSPCSLVDIAAHRSERRDIGQFFEDLWNADIPGMNDVLGSAQRFQRFGSQQPVSVRDDAD